ncbi:MAG: hypothetical protein ABI569_07880 [Casimicrobiaceae bacterium]
MIALGPIVHSSLAGDRCKRIRPAAVVVAFALAACAEYLGTSFSEIAPPEIAGRDVRDGARCALQTVNGAQPGAPWRLSRQHRVMLHGWALDGATLSTSDWLVVQLTKTGGAKRYYATTWARGPRDEVVRELGSGAAAARPGFDLTGTLQQIPPGTYDIDLIVGAPAGPVSCATGRQLVAV